MFLQILLNVFLLLLAGSVSLGAPDCVPDNTKCKSQANYANCIDIDEMEELDCVTYVCEYDDQHGHCILVRDGVQANRCLIHGQCFKVGEGPHLCTRCHEDTDGRISVLAGCEGEDRVCRNPGEEYQEGCATLICNVEYNAVSARKVGSIGCEMDDKCWGIGQMAYKFNCKQCEWNETGGHHTWGRECRDPRDNSCYEENDLIDVYCNTFQCANRGGIGWHRHTWDNCRVSDDDCVPLNSTSKRDGFCYFCDDPDTDPGVACLMCGECVKPGDEVTCNRTTHICDAQDIPDNITDGDAGCRIGGVDYDIGNVATHDCNLYACTPRGVMQVTTNCFYDGDCYRRGEMIDNNRCLKCVSDGATSQVQQGCKYKGQCYEQGRDAIVECKNKKCVIEGERLMFKKTEYQSTPCRLNDACYPVGDFYHTDQHCAECKPNGEIEYACKLSNGVCLKRDQDEVSPSSGCYRMECRYDETTKSLELAPVAGEPYTCLLASGDCLGENKTKTVNSETFSCHKGDACFHDTHAIPVGTTIMEKCDEIGCEEVIHGVKKVFRKFVKKYGCEYGDTCVDVNTNYQIDCTRYKCAITADQTAAEGVQVEKMCAFEGHCFKIDHFYIDSKCHKRKCLADFTKDVVEMGCKSEEQEDYCMSIGATLVTNHVTETCHPDDDNHSPKSCNFIGDETVLLGDTIYYYCNTYICEQRSGFFGLFLLGDMKCQLFIKFEFEPICMNVGEIKHCVECRANGEMNFKCIGDGRTCVEPGDRVDYRCGIGYCDPVNRHMIMKEFLFCNDGKRCVNPGDTTVLFYGGRWMQCTCVTPAARHMNGFQCNMMF